MLLASGTSNGSILEVDELDACPRAKTHSICLQVLPCSFVTLCLGRETCSLTMLWDSGWLQKPSWSCRAFCHTTIGKSSKSEIRMTFGDMNHAIHFHKGHRDVFSWGVLDPPPLRLFLSKMKVSMSLANLFYTCSSLPWRLLDVGQRSTWGRSWEPRRPWRLLATWFHQWNLGPFAFFTRDFAEIFSFFCLQFWTFTVYRGNLENTKSFCDEPLRVVAQAAQAICGSLVTNLGNLWCMCWWQLMWPDFLRRWPSGRGSSTLHAFALPRGWFNLSIGLHAYHTSMTWWETLQTFIPGNASSQQKWCPGFQSGAIFKRCYHVFEGFPCDLWRLQVGCGWPIPGHRENGKWLHIFGWQHWPVRTLWTQPWQSSFWTAILGCQSVLLRFLVTLPWTLSEAVNAPRICAVFTLGSWRFGGEAKTSKTLFLQVTWK